MILRIDEAYSPSWKKGSLEINAFDAISNVSSLFDWVSTLSDAPAQ